MWARMKIGLYLPNAQINFGDSAVTAYKLLSHQTTAE